MPTLLEAQFIRACVDVARPIGEGSSVQTRVLAEHAEAFEHAKLVDYFYPAFYRISPRGLDLLATADAIGFDPTTLLEPTPAPIPCDACENGRVVIAWNVRAADPEDEVEITAGCEKCGGSGEQPPLSPGSSVGDFVDALNTIRDYKPLLFDWRKVADDVNAALNAAHRFEDTHAAWRHAAKSIPPDWNTPPLVYRHAYCLSLDPYAIAPPIEPAPNPWTRDHDGMLSLLTRAEAEGLEVETQLHYDPAEIFSYLADIVMGGVPRSSEHLQAAFVLCSPDGVRLTVSLRFENEVQGIAITAVRLKDPQP